MAESITVFDLEGKSRLLHINSQGQLVVQSRFVDANDNELFLESNGGVPVNVQDQTSRPFDIRVNKMEITGLSLAAQPIVNSYTLQLSPGHGVTTGDSLSVIEEVDLIPHLWYGDVLGVSGDIITMDKPCPYSYSTSATVFTYTNNMNVDGSTTAQIFSITNYFSTAVDITRLMFHITDATSMDDAKFGGMPALTRGFLVRKKENGWYTNYFDIKNNGQLGELAYDKKYDDKAPAGVYGLSGRLTYAGQNKHGVTIRLQSGDSIEAVVQDDLTDLVSFTMMVQGHFVTD